MDCPCSPTFGRSADTEDSRGGSQIHPPRPFPVDRDFPCACCGGIVTLDLSLVVHEAAWVRAHRV
jgi:hypothetical protein